MKSFSSNATMIDPRKLTWCASAQEIIWVKSDMLSHDVGVQLSS